MTHLDEGLLLALRDDPSAVVDEHARHVETCPDCRHALEAVRLRGGVVASALESLDAEAGDLEQARLAVRRRVAAHGAAAAGNASLPARATRHAFWTVSRAAGILLVTAAGLSALPGSPVRSWIGRLTGPAPDEAPASLDSPRAAEPVAKAPPAEAGVRLPLAGGSLAVILHGAEPGTEIRVTWIPGDEAALFAPVGSRFTSGQGRLEATLAPGPVRVEIRRDVSRLTLEVDGSVLLRGTSEDLEVAGEAVERDASGITLVVPRR